VSDAESQEYAGVVHQLVVHSVPAVPCLCMGEQLLSWGSSLGVMPSPRQLGYCGRSPSCKAADPVRAGSE